MNIRLLDTQIKDHFKRYKEVLILLGSRQSGKTTLVQRLFPEANYLLIDNEPVRRALESYDLNTYKTLVSFDKPLILDEIHLLSDPGRAVKILYDQIPGLQLIITGSSSFHIRNKTSESLAGRKIDYQLFPLTFAEYLYQKEIISSPNFNIFDKLTNAKTVIKTLLADLPELLSSILLYGLYPAMLNHPGDTRYLLNFADSVIFKDLLDLQLIENRRLAVNLLQLLAHQIGNLINYAELAQKLQADQRTIKRYIDIFEQSFILFRVLPFGTNKRKEIVKSPKIYFYDTGLRNALINNFSAISLRPDTGALFENFIVTEVLKANSYLQAGYKINYWRNKQGGEIDLVLSRQQETLGIEIKYSGGTVSSAFRNAHPQAKVQVITKDNFYTGELIR